MRYFRMALTTAMETTWKNPKEISNSSSYIWTDFSNTSKWTHVTMNMKNTIKAWSVQQTSIQTGLKLLH